jgi:putative DNA primase/helicase
MTVNDTTRANNRDRLIRHIAAMAFRYRGRGGWVMVGPRERRWIDALVVCQAELEELIQSEMPENVCVVHFGNLVGLDAFGSVAYSAVIGRTLPAPATVELIAETLHGRRIQSIGDTPYPRKTAAVRLYGRDEGPIVATPNHPDPLAEAIRSEIAEGGVLQAIGRARAVNRIASNPVHIDVVSDMVIPIEVDEAIEWDAAQREADVLNLAADGFILGDGTDTAEWAGALSPDTWPDAQAYRDWRRRGGDAAMRAMVDQNSTTTRDAVSTVANSNKNISSLQSRGTRANWKLGHSRLACIQRLPSSSRGES